MKNKECRAKAQHTLKASFKGESNMGSKVIYWPAPTGEKASLDYELTVEGVPVFVHQARVRAKILENKGLWTHEPDCKGETASFAIFDIKSKVEVAIKPKLSFSNAVVLPSRTGIIPEIVDGVTVDGESMPPSEFHGVDADHQVENIALRGIRLNGKAITDATEMGIKTNKFVHGLSIEK